MFLFPFFPVFVNQFLSIFGQPISGMDSREDKRQKIKDKS